MSKKERAWLLAALIVWGFVLPCIATLLGIHLVHKPSAIWGAILGAIAWKYFEDLV